MLFQCSRGRAIGAPYKLAVFDGNPAAPGRHDPPAAAQADAPAELVKGFPQRAAARAAPPQDRRLVTAMAAADEAAPHLARLARAWLPRLPGRPRASQTIRSITIVRRSDPLPLDEAATCPWLTLDGREFRNCLAWDIDHPDGLERVLALPAGCPRPTLVQDPWSGRSHAVLMLAAPVLTRPGARPKPQRLANLAACLMAAALRATPLPRGSLIKSPWGRSQRLIGTLQRRTVDTPGVWEAHQAADNGLLWHTIAGDLQPAELRAIVAALNERHREEADILLAKIARFSFRKKRGEPDSRGRNCALFDVVRWWAYDHAETDAAAIEAKAARVNASFEDPLPGAEVSAMGRSIARFMNTRFRPRYGAGGRRGRDRAQGRTLDARERRQLAGRRTGELRAAATDDRLAAAVEQLRRAGRKITQAAVAKTAGASLATVKRRWPKVSNAALSGSSGLACRRDAPAAGPTTPSRAPGGTEHQRIETAVPAAGLAGFAIPGSDRSARFTEVRCTDRNPDAPADKGPARSDSIERPDPGKPAPGNTG